MHRCHDEPANCCGAVEKQHGGLPTLRLPETDSTTFIRDGYCGLCLHGMLCTLGSWGGSVYARGALLGAAWSLS